MHRWFFVNERESCSLPSEAENSGCSLLDGKDATAIKPIPTTDWPFCVTYDKPLLGNEYMGIIGNCDELGNWDPQRVALMGRTNCQCQKGCSCRRFELTINIPRNIDIEYRYCIVAYDSNSGETIIRFWEVHLKPRLIRPCQNLLKPCDRFGYKNDDSDAKYCVNRGWSTTETYIQFKIFNAPFIWLKQLRRLLYVHIQPMFQMPESAGDGQEDTSIARKRCEFEESSRLAYTEVANLHSSNTLSFQPSYGAPCDSDDMQLYHCSIAHPEDTLYRLDLYTFSYKSGPDEPPYHYGYGFIKPDQLVNTEGFVRVKINCASTHRPLIEMCVRYLIIRPMTSFTCDMHLTYQRFWRLSHLPLDVGHRGTGNTYKLDDNIHRENTLFAFKRAQAHNADMVEFDVQLTKDGQVVIYHDHVLKFFLQNTPSYETLLDKYDLMIFPHEQFNRLKLLAMGGSKCSNYFALPFEAFTYEQLRQAYALRFATNPTNGDRSIPDQMPFPLLIDILNNEDESLPTSLGFNIEIKWTQLDSTRRWEDNGFKPTYDRNVYVDTILEVVLKNAGERRIIFSSFDADICAMIRYKQNRYPVVLITEDPEKPVQYFDQRVNILQNAVYMASALEFFGLALHSNSILYHPIALHLLNENNLRGIVWGSRNTDVNVRDTLKRYGLVGVIYDRIDQMDQKGETLEGNVFTIDSARTRPYFKDLQDEELQLNGLMQAIETETSED
ncbi:uncharacterized protein Dwil_GK11537 [Drosophila willistoni]|uniref:GP-PDE domain-containing protein n=1 Tax=Drosophila willistoni TaxID=7260 RepID=B4N8Y4_DROWI|nr:glycerophosphocholine phosphodiesterase GPCPD1 [Drosophila willistoni]EDW80489.2 uncharacterized protein Dwil_GK11537 [Drosophila willistoni]